MTSIIFYFARRRRAATIDECGGVWSRYWLCGGGVSHEFSIWLRDAFKMLRSVNLPLATAVAASRFLVLASFKALAKQENEEPTGKAHTMALHCS